MPRFGGAQWARVAATASRINSDERPAPSFLNAEQMAKAPTAQELVNLQFQQPPKTSFLMGLQW